MTGVLSMFLFKGYLNCYKEIEIIPIDEGYLLEVLP